MKIILTVIILCVPLYFIVGNSIFNLEPPKAKPSTAIIINGIMQDANSNIILVNDNIHKENDTFFVSDIKVRIAKIDVHGALFYFNEKTQKYIEINEPNLSFDVKGDFEDIPS